MLPRIQDITAQTQQLVSGPVMAWQHYTRRGGILSWLLELFGLRSRMEFVAAASPDADLVFFWRKSPSHNWAAVNVSQLVNKQVQGRACAWTQKSIWPFNKKEFIAAPDPSGDLIVYRGAGGFWSAVNVSAQTGQKIHGPVTRWRHGGSDHLAAVAPGDELVVFSDNGGNWTVDNVSNATGVRLQGALTSWVTPNGPDQVPHIAGRTPAGELIVFWLSSSTQSWKHVDVSNITGRRIDGGLCNWQTRNGPYLVEHLAGRGASGELLVFWWSPQSDWQAVDVSHINSERINGVPAVYQHGDGDGENAEVLAFAAAHERLFLHWWKPSSDWVALDLSAATGEPVEEEPDCWNSYSSRYNTTIEYVAAQGGDYRLLLFQFDRKPRRMVEHLVAPYESLSRLRGVVKRLLVILWDWNDPAHPRPDKSALDANLFGASSSVNDYYRENSNGHFGVRKVDMRGWYDAKIDDPSYYQNTNDAGDSNQDGFVNQHHVKYKEAIELAHDDGFPFANYDSDQNGKLTSEELPIFLIVPGTGGRGFVRGINAAEYPSVVPLQINGLEFDSLVEIYSTLTPEVGIYTHEMGHLIGAGDMYWEGLAPGTFMKYAPGAYSVMDQHSWPPHYDGFAKMKLGWVSPRVVLHSGWYQFPAVADQHKIWALMDPRRNNTEYFLIENRHTAGTYEQSLPDQGLAVWHIIEDHQVYNALPCPPGMDAGVWAATQNGRQWSRLGVRLIRPVTSSFDDNRALWDSTDADTGYNLLSNDPDPTHSELRWADGTPSGFEIRSISTAGPTMQAQIVVPF